MALLGATAWDPSTRGTDSTAALLAMTASSATADVTFTAPASGNILVRVAVTTRGSGTQSQLLLGVLESTTVIGRQAPLGGRGINATTTATRRTSEFAVTGVTAGSHTYKLAYAVQVVSSDSIGFGGPNDTTASNADGAATLEVWDAPNLLVAKNYDPAVAVSKATTAALAMTAFDTTNLRATFTAPASGNVLVIGRVVVTGATTLPNVLLGVLEGATVVARAKGSGGSIQSGTLAATDLHVLEFSQVITGVTAGSHSYDFAYGVELLLASTNVKYGGPNDAVGADAWGMARFEVWSA